jgi:ABC-2 type transport system permease protein
MPAEAATGVIHDLGYQRYDGGRLSRLAIIRTLNIYSLRAAFGLGRGAKAKILPVGAFAVMCIPAAANAYIVARGGSRAFPYDTYVFQLRVLVMTIFVAAQAPELVSRDLRCRVLPLYFARPMRRGDYPLAKFTALTTACLAMIDIPVLLLYLGTVSSVHGGSAVWAETRALIPGLAIGLLWAVVLAAAGLAIASLSGRRAYATGAVAIFFFLSWTLAEILIAVGRGRGPLTGGTSGIPTTGSRLGGLASPFTILDGVRQWLGGTSPGPVRDLAGYGPAYGVALLVLAGASFAILATRYGKADAA